MIAWGLEGRITLADTVILDGALWLEPGVTCLMGASGVGKSTLLRVLAGLPTQAEVKARILRPDRIGWLAQDLALQPRLNVGQNIGLMQSLAGRPRDRRAEEALLADLDLGLFAGRAVVTLSGGQKARLALGRVLMQQADLILLDEPFAALDPETRARMLDLTRARLQGRTVLMVTHDRAEAQHMADRILTLQAGGLTA